MNLFDRQSSLLAFLRIRRPIEATARADKDGGGEATVARPQFRTPARLRPAGRRGTAPGRSGGRGTGSGAGPGGRGSGPGPRDIQDELAGLKAANDQRWVALRALFMVVDVVVGALAGLAAAWVGQLSLEQGLPLAALLAVGWPIALFACGLYTNEDLRSWASGVRQTPRLLVAGVAVSWPLGGAAWALGAWHVSRTAVTGMFVAIVLAAAGRALARAIAHRAPPLRQRTLIVGSGQIAGQIFDELRRHDQFGLEPIGMIDDDPHHVGDHDLPRLGALDDLPAILRDRSVDRVVIAFSRARHEDLLASIRACRDAGVTVHVVPRLFEFLDGSGALEHIGGLPLLSLGACGLSPSAALGKRVFDVVGSAIALVAVSPLLAASALAVRLGGRPVLVRDERIGFGGRRFHLLRFRTAPDADPAKNNGRPAPPTRVGGLLRRLALDELPQLVNVLRGDMSLVGPPPIRPTGPAQVRDGIAPRCDLRPGMTGPWQLSGRPGMRSEETVRFDYLYVSGWWLGRDFEILLDTVPAVLAGRRNAG